MIDRFRLSYCCLICKKLFVSLHHDKRYLYYLQTWYLFFINCVFSEQCLGNIKKKNNCACQRAAFIRFPRFSPTYFVPSPSYSSIGTLPFFRSLPDFFLFFGFSLSAHFHHFPLNRVSTVS
jgi:hypothetical protein